MLKAKFTCTKENIKATKSFLELYRRVLHNVNNEIVYLDDYTYTTSRKHLADFVNSLVDYNPVTKQDYVTDRLNSCSKSLSLLDVVDDTIKLVHNYPIKGRLYFSILDKYYIDSLNLSHEQIIQILDIPSSSYYRTFDQAIACFYHHLMHILRTKGYEFNEEMLA